MHDYHECLPGYSAGQILHDGCAECEQRSANDDHGIANLDRANFARAWGRAAEWNREGLADLSRAEIPLLQTLWAIQIKLEQFGIPSGTLPLDVRSL